jgi:tetratricopeptide (TPR) repeat protein
VPLNIPSALALALQYFRSRRGLSQKELADLLGKDPSLIRRYENGDKALSREQLEELLAPTGFGAEEIDIFLFVDRLVSGSVEEACSPVALSEDELRSIDRAVLRAVALGAETLREELIQQKKTEKVRQERSTAESLWKTMRQYSPEDRRILVEAFPEYRSWALAEKLCHESNRLTAHDADEALAVADLALLAASKTGGDDAWRAKVEGYAWLFVGNTRRVANDLDRADEAFAEAQRLLREGASAGSGILDESRRLDLEASLRKDQQRYPEALALLEESLRLNRSRGDDATVASLLLITEHVFERIGDHEGALATLEEAAPYVERSGVQYLSFALLFNKADVLYHLERYDEAASLFEQVQASAPEETLSVLRVLWLGARIAAGQERGSEAMVTLRHVEQEFRERRLPYDAALVALDRAVFLLKEGKTAEVRVLAVEMAWIFSAKGIDREALASLSLFCDAAKRETATIELAREVIAKVEKAKRSAPRARSGKKNRA